MSKRLRGCLGTFYRVESCHDRRWQQLGVWEPIVQSLTPQARRQQQRRKEPTAAVLDSQSVKDLYKGGARGYDAEKKIRERKRHFVVILTHRLTRRSS